MLYYVLNFLLSFFILGAMYVAVTVFFDEQMTKLLEYTSGNSTFISLATSVVNTFLNYFYVALVFCSLIVSLTRPVEHGIWLFKFLVVMFGLLMGITLAGIVYYLIHTGFYPEE